MKSLLATSIITITLLTSLQAQNCGPYWKSMGCSESDEPCCSASGQCGASQMHCDWSGRYMNTNQSAGSCVYSACSSTTDCCDRSTGNCMWNPDGRADSENFCQDGVNYNNKEYDIHRRRTTQPATSRATGAPTSKATTSPKPTTKATVAPTSKATTAPTTSPKPTTKATVAPTSKATTAPTTSPKPTTKATVAPTSKPTKKPTHKPCKAKCPPEHCHEGHCIVPCKKPPCKHCHHGNCSEDDEDGYNGATFANPALAISIAVICLTAAFAI